MSEPLVDKIPKVSKVTWKTVVVNPVILGSMFFVVSDDNSTLLLLATGTLLVGSALMPLGIPRLPVSVRIACGIIFVFGCSISGLGLGKILGKLFSDFPTLEEWTWMHRVPSAFEHLAILVWIFVALNIAPVTRRLLISTGLVAAAAAYGLTLDASLIRDALVFNVLSEIEEWKQAIEILLKGCAVAFWASHITLKLATTSFEEFSGKCILCVACTLISWGVALLLRNLF